MCMHVCICAYAYMCARMYVCMYGYAWLLCMVMYGYVYMYVYLFVCLYTRVYACMYVCMHVCMYDYAVTYPKLPGMRGRQVTPVEGEGQRGDGATELQPLHAARGEGG